MQESSYSVSQAVKLLGVQSHVLRYWEEELKLPIGRNEMGHRYYTRWDIQVFLSIKELKKKGYTLKEIGGLTAFFYKEKQEAAVDEIQEENREDRSENKTSLPPEFMEIISRLVTRRLQEQNSEEARFKRLDARIRDRQQTRREAAASMEKQTVKKKGIFHRG